MPVLSTGGITLSIFVEFAKFCLRSREVFRNRLDMLVLTFGEATNITRTTDRVVFAILENKYLFLYG